MYYYTCLVCGKGFASRYSSLLTCSKECRAKRVSHSLETWRWRGKTYTVTLRGDGYYYLMDKGHPNRQGDGYLKRARWVLSKVLGRPLKPFEVADHIDGDKKNDLPSNLRAMSAKTHGEKGHNPGRFKSAPRGETPLWIRQRISGAKRRAPWKPTPGQLEKMRASRKSFRKLIHCKECGGEAYGGSPTSQFCSQKCGKRYRRAQLKQV